MEGRIRVVTYIKETEVWKGDEGTVRGRGEEGGW